MVSFENKCKDVMDNKIKNIKPNIYEQILVDVMLSGIENKKASIEKYLRNKLNIPQSCSRHSKNYWIIRGWSLAESFIKARENNLQNQNSIYSQSFWLEKVNPITNKNYTVIEADFERNSRRPIRKEFWIKKGYSLDESVKLASYTKNQNNIKGAKKGIATEIRKATSKRCLEYYLTRGFDSKESEVLRSNHQLTFSKNICIQKYGETEGVDIWQNRQLKWKESLKKSGIYLGVSKSSLTFFEELSKIFQNLKFGYDEANIICSNNIYFVDCLRESDKKVIEYFGDYWHGNPTKFLADKTIKGVKAKDIWIKDQNRIIELENHGYKVLIIWELDVTKHFKETIIKCANFLNQ
jgi:hypothetical protein